MSNRRQRQAWFCAALILLSCDEILSYLTVQLVVEQPVFFSLSDSLSAPGETLRVFPSHLAQVYL